MPRIHSGATSAGDLLHLVRSGRATTRGALQEVTGLSRATVGQRLDRLFRAGWLREGAVGRVESPLGGRPSVHLEFDDSHAVVLAADLDTHRARAALLDLRGSILARYEGELAVDAGPDAVLTTLARWFAVLLKETGHPAGAVCGIGLAVPGPVDPASGIVVQPPIMPGWDGVDVPALMRRAFAAQAGGPDPDRGDALGTPVLVDNDANLMAYGEQRTAYPDCAAFALIKVSTGIGAGVVVGGELYRGVDGGAGDIGHVRVPEGADEPCTCGAHGCLAAVASGRALARRLTRAGVPAAGGADVRALLAAGNPAAIRLAREAGRRVGEVLATVVTLLNPGVLMVGGDLAGTPFLTGVRELLYERALPRSTARLQIVPPALGEEAGLVGGAALVVEHLYAPARVEERLAALGF
ncbi:ROK family protein [Streptomyces sp. NA04227]|uniref:ROK family transcriptional regulator n=1 Tax=Streptomyces sp. NA04227 TaxID=2742136 RepID=UPI001591C44D|nr:ROK family protein [Streptomyces sp. NA04227]QKW06365.1 ROK family protein [Streptomyces sp. NA04227]